VFAVQNIAKGKRLSLENIKVLRPYSEKSILPKDYEKVLGRCTIKPIKKGMLVGWQLVKK
jgi:sialic acid synthase SpsE